MGRSGKVSQSRQSKEKKMQLLCFAFSETTHSTHCTEITFSEAPRTTSCMAHMSIRGSDVVRTKNNMASRVEEKGVGRG